MIRIVRCISLLVAVLLASLPVSAEPTAPGDQYWDNRFGCHPTGKLFESAVFQAELYMVGLAGCSPDINSNTHNVGLLKSNGIAWEPVFNISDHLYTKGLTYIDVVGERLYIASTSAITLHNSDQELTLTGNIATFDGTTWAALPLPDAVDSWVINDMVAFKGNLVVSVEYQPTNSQTVQYGLFRWNGASWSFVAEMATVGMPFTEVEAWLAASANYLYVFGGLTHINGNPINQIARWNGSNWFDVGMPNARLITDVALTNDSVYVLMRDPSNQWLVKRWHNQQWLSVAAVVPLNQNGGLHKLGLSSVDNILYLYGEIASVNGVDLGLVAQWTGTEWQAIGQTFTQDFAYTAFNDVNSYYNDCLLCDMVAYQGQLVLVGATVRIGTYPSDLFQNTTVWTFDHTDWQPFPEIALDGVGHYRLPNAIENYVLAANDTGAYLGGWYYGAGSIPSRGHAWWDGSMWHDWSAGFPDYNDNEVFDDPILVDNDLYLIGEVSFYEPGLGKRVLHRSATGTWNELAHADTDVFAQLAWWNNQLYATGSFTEVNGVAMSNGVAVWTGTQWQPFDALLPNGVVEFTDVYATPQALYFLRRQGSVEEIFRWDGSTLSNISPPTAANIVRLAFYTDTLYGFGSGMWAFDGVNTWTQLSAEPTVGNLSTTVFDVAVASDGLFISGSFVELGGQRVCGLAHWNGSTWVGLGQGASFTSSTNCGVVYDIAAAGRNVYVSGNFEQLGSTQSYLFGIWHNPNGTNSAPQTVVEMVATGQGSSVEIDLHTYAWDLDYDSLTFSNLVLSAGTLTDLGNGRLRVQAPFVGSEELTLTYMVFDDHGGSAVGELRFTVAERMLTYLPFVSR